MAQASEGVQRHTRQKDAVLTELKRCPEFISAQDLHRRLQDAGAPMGLATVYRQLNNLSDAGVVDTLRLHGQQVFRLCQDTSHHHHLVCEHCGRTVEIEPPDEDWARAIAAKYGYTVRYHSLEIYGLCSECQLKLGAHQA